MSKVELEGVDHIVGAKPMQLAELLQAHAAQPDPVRVALARDGDRVTVTAAASQRLPEGAVVQLVAYTPEETVDIRRGENAGRTLSYHNIVRDLKVMGEWDGRAQFRQTARVPENMPVVVLVQEPGLGRILGAARLR